MNINIYHTLYIETETERKRERERGKEGGRESGHRFLWKTGVQASSTTASRVSQAQQGVGKASWTLKRSTSSCVPLHVPTPSQPCCPYLPRPPLPCFTASPGSCFVAPPNFGLPAAPRALPLALRSLLAAPAPTAALWSHTCLCMCL